jgi:YihY family inner membrane protein
MPPRPATTSERHRLRWLAAHPGAFVWRTLKSFRANQGLLLAGAVAYYALLSLVPLLILSVIALSHVIDQARLITALGQYLEFVAPGQSRSLVDELRTFIEHRARIGPVLLLTMIFFSALAFTVLENAMSVIFFHRVAIRRRRFLASAIMPYLFVLLVGVGLLLVTLMSGALRTLGTRDVSIFGEPHSLGLLAGVLLYLLGVAGELFLLTAVYMVMPVGRLALRHALIGAIAATLLWEATRHVLVWYYASMSQIQVVYGSFTTAVAVLLSVEFGAIVLLYGAQVIAEYERIEVTPPGAPAEPISTDA